MVRLSDDCFAHDAGQGSQDQAAGQAGQGLALQGLVLDAALADLLPRLHPVTAIETMPLSASLGRALAEPLTALLNVPPADNAAVDGYAVRHADLAADGPTRLTLLGRAAAGRPFGGPGAAAVPPGHAVRIFTGAPMPAGLDTVLMQEDCTADGASVLLPPGIARGANRRLAGEDIAAGKRMLEAGRRLGPADLAMAAACGHGSLRVRKPLRVALLSTGDEVNEAGASLPPGGIYDANRPMLAGLLSRLGCMVSDLGIQPDRPEALRATFAEAAASHDAILSSGGVSAGEEDHVKAAISALGSLHLWRLAIKPGRPVALGRVGKAAYFGLPGNPVAAALTFGFFARPLLARLAGFVPPPLRAFTVSADFRFGKKPGRREWLRVSLFPGRDGAWLARKYPLDGSAALGSLTSSDGVLELAESVTDVRPGDQLPFYPFEALGL